jgi:hypothetical protein
VEGAGLITSLGTRFAFDLDFRLKNFMIASC